MGIHDGHRARLRARYIEEGLAHFNEIDTLELLLFYAIPRRDTNELAHLLLQQFGSLDGVGEAAAESLQHARDGGPYISVEDLRIRSKISKSVIETLRAVGALDCLPETSQITLF